MISYEMQARTKKAAMLARALEDAGVTADEAEQHGDDVCWQQAAKLAGVNVPSAETIRMVISMMRNREGEING